MPPSGFRPETIRGLLVFTRDVYQNTIDKYRGQDLTEEYVLNDSIKYLEGVVRDSVPLALDGVVSEEGLRGLQTFVSGNWKDLVAEIHSGKKQEGQAMQDEIDHIGQYLEQFRI